jgi:hypothetical protein
VAGCRTENEWSASFCPVTQGTNPDFSPPTVIASHGETQVPSAEPAEGEGESDTVCAGF